MFLAFLLAVAGLSAQPKYITTSVRNVGPGVVHTKMICPTAPYAINVLKIDLSNPYVHIETVKAKDQLHGYEGTSRMSARKQTDGHLIVGAVNGDFYGDIPINTQVINGEVLRDPISLSTFGVDITGKPYIGIVSLLGSVVTKTGSNPIHSVNGSRYAGQMVLYNSFYGSSTETNNWGREALVRPLTSWIVNDTVLCVVDTVVNAVGNMSIPKGEAVLSGHGASSTFLADHVQLGDTIKVCVNLLPSLPKLVQAIGGYPKIIKDGLNYAAQGYSEEGGPEHAFDLHPRTAVGFSQDEKTAYFVTVDGRITTSKGMSLPELADFMIGLGVYRAVNLDGGGSTTMVVRGTIQNTPSGGAERTVSNALMAVTTAPVGEMTSIQVDPQYYRLYDGNPLQFAVTGWDDNFNPKTLDPAKLSFQIDSNIGSISSTGKLTASGIDDSGFVYITYDTYKDTARIFLKKIGKISILPEEFMIDTIQVFPVRFIASDEDNLVQNVARNRVQWEVLDPTIGTIDSVGNFRGIAEGSTKIVARFGTLSDTISVTVQIGRGDIRLNSMEATSDWTVSGLNYDSQNTTLAVSDSLKTEGDGSLELKYQFVRLSNERSWAYISTDIPIYGVPSSIEVDFKSDGWKHKLYFLFSDIDGDLYRTGVIGNLQDTTFATPSALFSSMVPMANGTYFNYPVRLRGLQIQMGNSALVGSINHGTIFLDNLRIVYPDVVAIYPANEKLVPEGFRLLQNYPNPFNPTTRIRFDLPKDEFVSMTVYDVMGRAVKTLLNERLHAGRYEVTLDGREIPSGVYFCRVSAGQYSQTIKMILLK